MEVQLNGGSISDKVRGKSDNNEDNFLVMITMELPFDCHENKPAVLSDEL